MSAATIVARGAIAFVVGLGCTGQISQTVGESGDEPGPGGTGPGGTGPGGTGMRGTGAGGMGGMGPGARCQSGPSPLRRLTNTEYENTLGDLFWFDVGRPSLEIPGDAVHLSFDNNAEDGRQAVVRGVAAGYSAVAQRLSDRAVTELDRLLGCSPVPSSAEAACAQSFIQGFGKRAFRRPLTTDERDRFMAYQQKQATASDFPTSIKVTLSAFLQAPQFLYRLEPGGQGGALGPYEVASRLSYLFWSSMPDPALMVAAEAGELSTVAGVEKQARRLLASPRARTTVAHFFQQWLELDGLADITKDAKAFPAFNEKLKQAMRRETEVFTEHAFFDGDGGWTDLFSAPFTWLSKDLAPLYGGPVAGTTPAFNKVSLDRARYAGLLTHPSLLAMAADETHPDPIRRGKLVREKFLCDELPPPPPDVNTALPPIAPNMTNREHLAAHSSNPSCGPCHRLIDPIGFGFEHYDAIGRWRPTDRGLAIDDSGEVIGAEDAAGPFKGVRQLGDRLAGSGLVRRCMATQWFRYASGRQERDVDACTLQRLVGILDQPQHSLQDMLIALATSSAFLSRENGGQ